MSFANNYLEKRILFPAFIKEPPSKNLEISIVIPCFNEPELIISLESLWKCTRPNCNVEVIVVINSASNSDILVLNQNAKSLLEVNQWTENHKDSKLRVFAIHVPDLTPKDAGVGLARKIGMDEAFQRFDLLEKPNGIIVGFDADSKCEENYLVEIYKFFEQNTKTNGCSIHYEHPIEGSDFEPEIYRRIIQYELYLRYYINALRFAKFPYSFQTIGSSFAVIAQTYANQGGMNKKKAGEDFYFLQKIIPLGSFADLKSTTVIPSPRPSDRVPFGTGAAIAKMQIDTFEGYLSYDFQAFIDLKKFIKNCFLFHKASPQKLNELVDSDTYFPASICHFLKENDFQIEITKINENSTHIHSYYKRFFNWFTAFQVLKFLNFAHGIYYKKKEISEVSLQLLSELNFSISSDCNEKDLLIYLRNFDKQNHFTTKYPNEQ